MDKETIETAAEMIRVHEGTRDRPYRCTAGKLTVGVGRNIDDVPFGPDEIELMYANDLSRVVKDMLTFPWYSELDGPRQAAMMDMRFQLGPNRFRGFSKMLAAMADGDYERAAEECLDSRYARQVPNRARTIAHIILTGELP